MRYVEGLSAGGIFAPIAGSAMSTISHTVTGLKPGTQYTFEVLAENGQGDGTAASVTGTTATPTWSFTLRDSANTDVTELTEGGDAATATVMITNNVRFFVDQTVTLKWGTLALSRGLVLGAGGESTITILAGEASGNLEISAPQDVGGVLTYTSPVTLALTATHGGTEIGGGIDLSRVDDETVPEATITQAPTTVNEGDSIEVEITLTPPFNIVSSAMSTIVFAVTDTDGALTGTLPTSFRFSSRQETTTISLTAAENTTQNDGARQVTFALQLNPDSPYTLSATSTVITVRDDDTPPLAVRNLMAQAGDTEAILTWDAPAANTPDHGQPVLRYEYRVKVGTGSFSNWGPIPGGDANTRSHTFTGLTNEVLHTYEVAAVNVAGRGAKATVTQMTATPAWELTLTDSSRNAVTELVEGGASATVTVRITDGVTFSTAQTVTLEWDGLALDTINRIRGAGGVSAITIPPGQSSGTLDISAPDPGGVAAYDPPHTAPLRGDARGEPARQHRPHLPG